MSLFDFFKNTNSTIIAPQTASLAVNNLNTKSLFSGHLQLYTSWWIVVGHFICIAIRWCKVGLCAEWNGANKSIKITYMAYPDSRQLAPSPQKNLLYSGMYWNSCKVQWYVLCSKCLLLQLREYITQYTHFVIYKSYTNKPTQQYL